MPPTGRPPKPTELKRRLGNPGKRALPAPITALAPAITPGLPAAPAADELVAALMEAGAGAWIGKTDRPLLQLVEDDWAERAKLRAFLDKVGMSYVSESKVSGMQIHPRPELLQLREVEKRLDRRLSLLGLTPTDRSRLGVAEVKAQKTKLEILMSSRPTATG